MPRNRTGEVVCCCAAYSFPHRMFGGACRLARWVGRFFEPHRRECLACNSLTGSSCEVTDGIETPMQCPELREFVKYEGVKLYGAAREAWERSQRVVKPIRR